MIKAKKLTALLFLGIFLLVKISPFYCAGSYLPLPAVSSVLPVKAFRQATGNPYLVRMDKCVIDSDPVNNIPKIKFAGTIFSIPAIRVQLLGASSLQAVKAPMALIYPDGRYLAFSILRI